jgi:hypothetical protein
LSREARSVSVAATFVLVLSEFDITAPQYMGVGVGDRLIVEVTFAASPPSESGNSR